MNGGLSMVKEDSGEWIRRQVSGIIIAVTIAFIAIPLLLFLQNPDDIILMEARFLTLIGFIGRFVIVAFYVALICASLLSINLMRKNKPKQAGR